MSRLFSRTLRSAAISLALSLSLGFSGAAVAGDAVTEAREAADLFRKSDSSLGPFFRDSAGYAVFPSVVKGGLGLGGAGGSGTVFQRAAPARTPDWSPAMQPRRTTPRFQPRAIAPRSSVTTPGDIQTKRAFAAMKLDSPGRVLSRAAPRVP